MRRHARVTVGLVFLLGLAIGPALFASPRPVVADEVAVTGEPVENVTTELQPGWNLAGWTEPAADVQAIFERIPELELVYAWDADSQRFRLAAPTDSGILGDLRRLTPGMGLWLFVTGEEPVTWTRPIVAQAASASLREGWNLVVWAGGEGVASRDALTDIDDILVTALDVNGRWPLKLTTGDVFWLDLSGAREWGQVYESPQIEFLGDFSEQYQSEVRAHIDDVVAFYFQRLGLRVPGVVVRYGDPELFGCSGNYQAPVINMTDCLSIFAHEYVHAIQEHLTGGGQHPPLWLREGDADFWAAVYRDAVGAEDYGQYMREYVLPSARDQGFQSTGYSYESYHVRVHVLVKHEGTAGLLGFYRKAASLGDWHAAFEEIYGMSFDEFAVVFAQEMLTAPGTSDGCGTEWFEPELTRHPTPEDCRIIEGVITDLAGNPRSGVQVGVERGVIAHYDAFHVAKDTVTSEGAFSLKVPEGRYSLVLITDFAVLHYRGDGTLSEFPSQVAPIDAFTSDATGIVVSYGVLSGTILPGAGQVPAGLSVQLHVGDASFGKGVHGGFQFFIASGTYLLELGCLNGSRIGWYDGNGGIVLDRSQAAEIVMEDADVTDIVVNLPPSARCN